MKGKIKPQEVRLGASRLVYESWGAGPPVVLVHGLSGSARWWERNIPALVPHFTVYAIDLVGFGNNRARRPLPLRMAAELIAAFIGYLDVGPAHVVGHSMGGHIATHLAAEHPDRVQRLVLAAASGLARNPLLVMALRLPRVSLRTAPGFQRTLSWDAARAGPLNLLRAAHELLRDDVTALLPKINAPTLILSGELDLLIPPEMGARQHAAIAHSEYVVLPDAGHILMWDNATLFNELMVDFLLHKPRLLDLDQNAAVDKLD